MANVSLLALDPNNVRRTIAAGDTVPVHTLSVLGGTTVGQALFKLANPSAVSFIRINADNSVTARSDTNFRSDLGLGTAALQDIGNSGSTVPMLNGANLWSQQQDFLNNIVVSGAIEAETEIIFTPYSHATLAAGYLWYDSIISDFKLTQGGAQRTLWHSGNTLAIGTSQGSARTALGLGTAAVQNIGTSGGNVPLLNGANTHSGLSIFTEDLTGTGSLTGANPTAFVALPVLPATVTGNYASFRSTVSSVAASFNTSQVTHYNAQAWSPGAGHTITTQYGFRCANISAATTNYGFFGALNSVTGNQWNFYASGLAPNYFAGKHFIGDPVDYGPLLQVATLGSTQPTSSSATVASFCRSTSTGAACQISVISGNAATSVLNLGDTDDENIGAVSYDNATEAMTLRCNNTSAAVVTTASITLAASPALGDDTKKVATTEWTKVAMSMLPQTIVSAARTWALTDLGGHWYHPAADTTARIWTIPPNSGGGSVAFNIGTIFTGINGPGAGALTIAVTTDTLRWLPTGATGSRTVAANGMFTVTKVTATEWTITGVGIT